MSKLRECPFCGGKAREDNNDYLQIAYVLCDSCGACVSFRKAINIQQAIKAWNTRKSEVKGNEIL